MKEITMKTFTSSPLSPIIQRITARQAELGISHQQVCDELGIEREIVLTLILQGSMRLPLTKLPALAKFLDLDAMDLLRTALPEMSPGLLEVVEGIFNPLKLTTAEVNLIHHLRKLSGARVGAPVVFEGRGVIALVAA